MKRLFAVLLAMMLVFGIGAAALGESGGETEGPVDASIKALPKIYKLVNGGTSNPAETFTFTIANAGMTDTLYTEQPPFAQSTYTIGFAEGEATAAGDTNTVDLTLPAYDKVGIFTYLITETAGDTAGVIYDTSPVYLKVIVIEGENGKVRVAALHYATEDGDKLESLTNTYSAGELAITKSVTGNMGEKDRYFKVTVTLTSPEGLAVESAITINTSELTGTGSFANPTVIAADTPTAFYLKDGETLKLGNIPYGVTYTVVEDDYTGDGYDAASYSPSDTAALIDSASDAVTITNNKEMEVDTGISLDDAPYWILIGAVVLAGVLLLMKRRPGMRRG